MLNIVFGTKQTQSHAFLENGMRIPITTVRVPASPVVSVKTKDKDGYIAVQVGIGEKKKVFKSIKGHLAKANLKYSPRFLREVRLVSEQDLPQVGTMLKAEDVLTAGDAVDVSGISKGKGFAGGVKRHHFKGGPRTHGQSDRERAPGSIGQTTTPGRVYKGKRMAGRMGNQKVTVKNLTVMAVEGETVIIKGLIPGILEGLVYIKKTGQDKKFTPLLLESSKTKEKNENLDTAEKLKTESVAENEQAEPVAKQEEKEEENA